MKRIYIIYRKLFCTSTRRPAACPRDPAPVALAEKHTGRRTHARLHNMLIMLTLLCLASQVSFFVIHYHVSDLFDSVVKSSLSTQFFHAAILLPIFSFLLVQLIAYALLVTWTWFIATACGALFKISRFNIYLLGLFFWAISWIAIFTLNNYFFQDSFFAGFVRQTITLSEKTNYFLMVFSCSVLSLATFLAVIYAFFYKKYRLIASLFIALVSLSTLLHIYDNWITSPVLTKKDFSQPNIILIGLDSLRPDFIHYFGNANIRTPNIDRFLQNAVVFTDAYTPLARTFPAWVSILTAKYPKQSGARNNLSEQKPILKNETLAKRLQRAGYETIYATDEKRFSNMTHEFGFDKLIGPRMGIDDFILGGLSDFPLTNLLINLRIGQWLFPYNYANRAAAITYEPDNFLKLVQSGLVKLPQKPLFLSIHFCVSHWPYTWAHDQQHEDYTFAERYQSSVEAVDKQLGQFLSLLKTKGLLDHSLLVLLSDHGTGLGLLGDRVTAQKYYQGDHEKLRWIPRVNISEKNHPNISTSRLDTSYGQGTDVLSLKQYHVLLAFNAASVAHHVYVRSSLLDIAPTVLDYLNLAPLTHIDGISLKNELFSLNASSPVARPLFLESGYSLVEIQKSKIDVGKVIQQSISGYQINPSTALLTVLPSIENANVAHKQRALLWGDWLLARYPEAQAQKLVAGKNHQLVLQTFTIPAYFVLVNIKTMRWTIGLNSAFAKQAPLKRLLAEFDRFYGNEIEKTLTKKAVI